MFFLPFRDFLSLWIAAASFMVSLASLFAAIAACRVAKSALSQAILVAEREQRDWRQRKWFDLYFKASQAYDALERFQTVYESTFPESWGTPEMTHDWNNLMHLFREVGAMAVVFPKNTEIDKLFAAVAVFSNPQEAFSKDRLKAILDAMEGIRQKALVEPTVLG